MSYGGTVGVLLPQGRSGTRNSSQSTLRSQGGYRPSHISIYSTPISKVTTAYILSGKELSVLATQTIHVVSASWWITGMCLHVLKMLSTNSHITPYSAPGVLLPHAHRPLSKRATIFINHAPRMITRSVFLESRARIGRLIITCMSQGGASIS